MSDLMRVLLYSIGISFLIKLIFWVFITDVNKRTKFFASFARFYSIFHMHDAPSQKTKVFWEVSNIFNVIFWVCSLVVFFLGLFIVLK